MRQSRTLDIMERVNFEEKKLIKYLGCFAAGGLFFAHSKPSIFGVV